MDFSEVRFRVLVYSKVFFGMFVNFTIFVLMLYGIYKFVGLFFGE